MNRKLYSFQLSAVSCPATVIARDSLLMELGSRELTMFLKSQNPYLLIVGMTGVKMGDRFVQIGCAHGGRLAAVAGKVGLSGRAVVVAPDESSAARARKGAADAGVLVEVEVAPPTRLPLENDAFDLALVDDTAGLLGTMRPEGRVAAIRELVRVLRPGGRVMIVGAAPRGGRSARCSRARKADRRLSRRATPTSRSASRRVSSRCERSRNGRGSCLSKGSKSESWYMAEG